MGIGAVGVVSSLLLWHDAPHTARLFGVYSRDLAGIAGASALFSGLSLIQEVGVSLRPRRSFRGITPTMLLAFVYLSLTVTLALVTYSATVSINVCLLPPPLC